MYDTPVGWIECDICEEGFEVELVHLAHDGCFSYDIDVLAQKYPNWRFLSDFTAYCPDCRTEEEDLNEFDRRRDESIIEREEIESLVF